MNKGKLYRVLKILCMVTCTVFLLAACANKDGMKVAGGEGYNSQGLSQEQKDCWQKSLIEVFYKNIGNLSLSVYKNLTAEDLMSLMILAFTIWMAFQILRHISSPTPDDMGEFWTKILRKATLCVACGYLASSSSNIMYALNTFVMPIYMALLEFAAHVLDLLGSESAAKAAAIKLAGSDVCEKYNYTINQAAGCKINGAVKLSTTSFPQQPLDLMGCMACAVGSRLDVGYSIASRLLAQASLIPVIIAGFFFAAFTITKLGFVLYLVDSVFRLAMMVAIMPFLIMFYPFEQTRKWTSTGFKIILNSASIMLCLAVLVGMTIFAMQNILTDADMGIAFGNINEYKMLGSVPLSMIFLGFVIVKASSLAVSLSDSVTGGGGDTKFQKKAEALVGTVEKAAWHAVTAGAGRVATAALEHSARLRALQEKAQKVKAKVDKVQHMASRLAGRE